MAEEEGQKRHHAGCPHCRFTFCDLRWQMMSKCSLCYNVYSVSSQWRSIQLLLFSSSGTAQVSRERSQSVSFLQSLVSSSKHFWLLISFCRDVASAADAAAAMLLLLLLVFKQYSMYVKDYIQTAVASKPRRGKQ